MVIEILREDNKVHAIDVPEGYIEKWEGDKHGYTLTPIDRSTPGEIAHSEAERVRREQIVLSLGNRAGIAMEVL